MTYTAQEHEALRAYVNSLPEDAPADLEKMARFLLLEAMQKYAESVR